MSAATAQSVSIAPEDAARADLYTLLATLFFAPPTQELFSAIAGSDDIAAHAAPDAPLAAPLAATWRRLQRACELADERSVHDEFSDLFLGVGKAKVPLTASWYRTGFMNDAPLVAVRADLTALGLSRLQSTNDAEDHVAALTESMRLLISGGSSDAPAPVAVQKRFFTRHIGPWYQSLAQQIESTEGANFYAVVAALVKTFLDTESAQFENY